jgi:hypothetical protein
MRDWQSSGVRDPDTRNASLWTVPGDEVDHSRRSPWVPCRETRRLSGRTEYDSPGHLSLNRAIYDREEGAVTDRLPPELRADLIEFARDRIEQCWEDAGVVPAQVLAENIVLAQEFAWMSHFTRIDPDMADRLANGAYK